MAITVTPIPATKSRFASAQDKSTSIRRVAGYARVSTDKDEQFTSFEAQVDYYTRFIKEHKDWEFVNVYTDEGISGTSTKHRAGFNRMIADAKEGKIDLIITKSLSRFARNTVDTLTTIRELKSKNVECFFEKENIWTFDSKGELLLTIMSSLAESESRSISDNIRWSVSKKFEQGKFSLPYKKFLGYDRGEDGMPVVNEKEAKVVRAIYQSYLMGLSPYAIAKELTEKEVPRPSGQIGKWSVSTIQSILSNEKYAGNAILQKTFCQDFLDKKKVKNTGQMTQYLVTGSHEAIVTQEKFDLVQQEIKNRKRCTGYSYYSANIFCGKIVCGQCNGFYGPKLHHSTDKYRRTLYRCNDKYESSCSTPFLSEEEIKTAFVKAVNKLQSHKDEILLNIQQIKAQVLSTQVMQKQLDELEEKIKSLKETWMSQYSSGPLMDVNSLEEEYTKALKKQEKLKATIQSKTTRALELDKFCSDFAQMDGQISQFSEQLWLSLLDHVVVNSKESLEFVFRNGEKIRG